MNNCTEVTPLCPVELTVYGYYPSLPANAFFAAWFAVLFFPNIALGVYYKTWSHLIALCLGCMTEAVGYGGRIMLYDNPWNKPGFQMQVVCLILGPAFNSAAIYVILKRIVQVFGPEYSLIKPERYTWIFIVCDVVSLVLQGTGGGMAATADTDIKKRDRGTNIMIVGICWQVFTLTVFAVVVAHYLWQRRRAIRAGHPLSTEARAVLTDKKFKLFVFGVASAFLAIYIRCVYRIPELTQGWGSKFMREEPSFIALEGAMIAYATLVQIGFHPGFCFPQPTSQSNIVSELKVVEDGEQVLSTK